MTYDEAMSYLINSYKNNQKKGFTKVIAAMELLGAPQDKINIIHVAGTNGKGSTCAMIKAILMQEGHKVGLYSSPHLVKVNERFMINNAPISDIDFGRYMGRIADVSREVLDGDSFSYFEILTMMAFCYFHDMGVDFLLLEVGIGGRLDITNIITRPILCVITAIGLDHMEILGHSIEEIAKEKAGIIKENCPVVLSENVDVVYNIVQEIADSHNSPVLYAKGIDIKIIKEDLKQTSFIAKHEGGDMAIDLNLAGRYQLSNAKAAITAAAALNIGKAAITRGLSQVYWPGRMELVSRQPDIILEGAHNMQGARVAAGFLQNLNRPKTLLMAIFNDKEYEGIAEALSAQCDNIVFTKPAYGFRACEPQTLANLNIYGDKPVHVEDDFKAALRLAIDITPADGLVFCTGSLYLVGDIRKLYKEGL